MTPVVSRILLGRALRGAWWVPLAFVAVLVGCSSASSVEATAPEAATEAAAPEADKN